MYQGPPHILVPLLSENVNTASNTICAGLMIRGIYDSEPKNVS